MPKYPVPSPCHPGNDVCDLAYTMHLIYDEGAFEDEKEEDDEDENQTEDN